MQLVMQSCTNFVTHNSNKVVDTSNVAGSCWVGKIIIYKDIICLIKHSHNYKVVHINKVL